jgi:hypothetical protein
LETRSPTAHSSGFQFQSLKLVERGDPLKPARCVGLAEIGVIAVVDSIPTNDQSDRRDVHMWNEPYRSARRSPRQACALPAPAHCFRAARRPEGDREFRLGKAGARSSRSRRAMDALAWPPLLCPEDLIITQYSLLANIESTGHLRHTVLAAKVGMERSTLTRNLDPLTEEQISK